MGREKWNPTKTSYICSQHFLASDYNYPPSLTQAVSLKQRYLKYDAVPSIFDFPDHLKKKPVKERNPKKREREVQHLSSDSNLPRAPKMPKLDHTCSATNVSPRKLKKKYSETIKKKNKIIQNLRRKNLRREKTIKGSMIELKSAKMISKECEATMINYF